MTSVSSQVRVGVIGAGLIGGSVCRALRRAGLGSIVVHTPSASTASAVSGEGFATVDSVEGVVAVSDVVFVCVPMGAQQSVFEAIADTARNGVGNQIIVTDVGSVKGSGAREASALFASAGVTYVPGHPMAGTEESGFGASSDNMFDGATWVLCPENSGPDAVLSLMNLVVAMGAKVSLIDIDSHDAAVAAVSHLPYLMAAALANSLPDGDARDLALRLAAGSFRDGTRVASSEPWLSASMVNLNGANVEQNLATAIGLLTQMREALARGDDAAVLGFFERARTLRATYAAVKTSSETETLSVPAGEALSLLVASCKSGALIRSVAASDNQWNVVLER